MYDHLTYWFITLLIAYKPTINFFLQKRLMIMLMCIINHLELSYSRGEVKDFSNIHTFFCNLCKEREPNEEGGGRHGHERF